MSKQTLLLMSFSVVLLTACGGGGGGGDADFDVTTGVPAQATTDPLLATVYIGALTEVPTSTTDTLEPVAVPDMLATSDSAEPVAIPE